jgi:hypothetical protein
MNLEKKIVDNIILNRSITLGDLVNKDKGIINRDVLSYTDKIDALDTIFYSIEKLERNNLVEISKIKNSSGKGSNYFKMIDKEDYAGKDDKTIISRYHWFVEEVKNRYVWKITAKSGLIEYAGNSYKTIDEKKWDRQVCLSVGIAILSSILTGLVTLLISSYICLQN